MSFRFPQGPVPAPASLGAGAALSRNSGSGGGGNGGGTPGDVLNFSGPQNFDGTGGVTVGTAIDLADRPFTLTMEFTSTDGSQSQSLFEVWPDGDRSFLFRIQSGSSFQELVSGSGSNSTGGLFAFNDLDPAGERYTVVVQRVGTTLTVTINDVLEDTETRASYRTSAGPAVIGSDFIGTIHAMTLVFDD
jgi:hypothetical protein